MILAAAFGEFWFAVEHVDGVVIGGVLPGWRNTRCPGCWLDHGAGRISACGSWLIGRLLYPCEIACGAVDSERVVAYCLETPFWNAVFETEYQLVTWPMYLVIVCVETHLIDRVPPQHSEVGKWLQEGIGYF